MLASLALVALCITQKPSQDPCTAFHQKVHDVYNFRPSHLTPAQKKDKLAQMDEVWKMVKDDPSKYLPCLRTALQDPKSDAWFRVDGSGLLCEVDPSLDAKKVRLGIWLQADWQDVAPEDWMRAMTQLGMAGLDTSPAGKRWLDDRSGKFSIAEHALEVGPRWGTWFLFGSMDEAFATPMLAKLVVDKRQAVRDRAFEALVMQAAPEAFTVLIKTDLATISPSIREQEWTLLKHIGDYPKHPVTSVTRESLLVAFKAFIADDPKPLEAIQVGADEKHDDVWGGLLEKDDFPLLRLVRRKRMTYLSDEALDDYVFYSDMLLSLTATPEFVVWTKQLSK